MLLLGICKSYKVVCMPVIHTLPYSIEQMSTCCELHTLVFETETTLPKRLNL